MSKIDFAWESLTDSGIGRPNLASHLAEPLTQSWREFDRHWPWVVPLRLLMYLNHAKIDYQNYSVQSAPCGSWYPISWSWFDFAIDYISLMSELSRQRVRQGDLRILFYYHEGDNPRRICDRIEELLNKHLLPGYCYVLISSNSAAEHLPNALYFDDHECFFRYVNRRQNNQLYRKDSTSKDFTLLSRTHKWWRCSVVTDLWRLGLLNNSLWSYNTQIDIGDDPCDNPISIDTVPGLRNSMDQFIANGPHVCDMFDAVSQNDHHQVNTDLYHQSSIHIVLETHFDADQSNGTFLTEKTWKCIKYQQPFVIVGPAGSLAVLRKHGYQVFDGIINNHYDEIQDPTQRWLEIRDTISKIKQAGTDKIAHLCRDHVHHNHRLFHQREQSSVNTLIEELQCL